MYQHRCPTFRLPPIHIRFPPSFKWTSTFMSATTIKTGESNPIQSRSYPNSLIVQDILTPKIRKGNLSEFILIIEVKADWNFIVLSKLADISMKEHYHKLLKEILGIISDAMEEVIMELQNFLTGKGDMAL
ncbi:uncharacterized protein [Euphorbia lathyris]|uniref:uncharacterized protein isoform X1 n=1 Tax=Euphorbia lathyris TaxID=212925 RepID=UPI0033141DD1